MRFIRPSGAASMLALSLVITLISVAASSPPAQAATSAPGGTVATAPADDAVAAHVLRTKVRRGESLYSLFKQHDIELADLERLVKSSDATRELEGVRAGHRLDIITSGANRVVMIRYQIDRQNDLLVTRSGTEFTSIRLPADSAWRAREAGSGKVVSSPSPTVATVVTDRPTLREVLSHGATATQAAVVTQVAAQATAPATVAATVTGRTPAVLPVTAAAVPDSHPLPSEADLRLVSHVITPGDSLFTLFKHRGLNQLDLHEMTRRTKHRKVLGLVRPGQKIDIKADPSGNVQALTVHVDDITRVEFEQGPQGFKSSRHQLALDRRVTTVSGVVSSSLFESGLAAGLSNSVIMQMVNMFSWDIDFALDIREGDRFSVVFETLYLKGSKLRDGNLLAAEFVNQGRAARGVRFESSPGRGQFFTPKGMSMRKAFLRTPVNFSRISSRFTKRRYHPVLHRVRAHKGVDYAAARGTPVKAAGDGKVIFAGRKGAYGNAVVIAHGSKYSTLYGHLHRIARGVKVGKRVKQGDRIGSVGSTGLATGPHLHYEFRVGGVHKDPLKVTLPRALPLDKKLHKAFNRHTRPLLAKLDELSRLQLALLRKTGG